MGLQHELYTSSLSHLLMTLAQGLRDQDHNKFIDTCSHYAHMFKNLQYFEGLLPAVYSVES